MGNRCSSCNKFVGLEQGDPEVNDLEIDGEGRITYEVHVPLNCLECGDELKYTDFSGDVGPSSEMEDHIEAHKDAGEADPEWEVEEVWISADDRYETKDRHGKVIKNFRYQRHYYGFVLDYKVTCNCGAEFEGSIDEEEMASAFEENY